MVKIASFDIMDTVLTRLVGSPESAFLLLGRRLSQTGLIHSTPEAFARSRIDAESRVYRNLGAKCTLDAIYAELFANIKRADVDMQKFIDMELSLEELILRPLPGAVQRVRERRASGCRVIFLSDIYLNIEFMRRQLNKFRLWQEGDRCYLSSQRGSSKVSGGLYLEMLVEEKMSPKDVIHEGNSYEHDIQPARNIGMQVKHYHEADLNRYERLLEEHTFSTEGFASLLAGASRLARLNTPARSSTEAALRDVAAGVIAPTVTGFAFWLLKRAEALELKRLYFISRDGQFLLDTAKSIAQVLGQTIELRYLYGSRQAWNPPAIIHAKPEELAWVWDSTDILTIRSLFARLDIDPEVVRQELIDAGFTRQKWDLQLTQVERARLKQLINTSELQAWIIKIAAEKRQIMIRYLEQEELLGHSQWGIVDLGWFGSMQNALSAVLAKVGSPAPIGFYFALLSGDISDQYPANREVYYFDERLSQGFLNRIPDLIPLMEMFCTADHGTVVDYVERDGLVQPLLKESWNQPAIDWGLPIIRETVKNFLSYLLLDTRWVNPWVDTREAVTAVLRAFWLTPTREEALAWSGFPWEDGLGWETTRNPLAQAYQWRDIFRTVREGKINQRHRAAWLAGSLALSSRWIARVITGLDTGIRRSKLLKHHATAGARDLILAISQRLKR